jgi:pantothenate kinase
VAIELNSLDEALNRVISLTEGIHSRAIIGLVGKPGAGKSTLSSYLLKKLPKETTALVPMDGFHLSNAQLALLDRSDRKGAPDTFDVHGYIELLRRIKTNVTEEIYFPMFHREIEESIAAEGVIHPHTSLVITEGNYLLLSGAGWSGVAPLLFLTTEEWPDLLLDILNLAKTLRKLTLGHMEQINATLI